jgi:general secretion pathway protein B
VSYILDALRRADAERERGAVPSLQSQQHTIIDDDAATARPRSLVWAVVALALALLALLGWNLLGGGAAPPPPRAPIEGSITTPVPTPLPALQPAPALPTATASAVPTAPATPAQTATASAAPTLQPAPTSTATSTSRTGADARRAAPAAPAKRVAATTPATHGAAGATPEPRVYAQSELPDEIRRDLPKIAFNGSSYSGDAASRMVMINGQVFHEGDRLGPDLVLERIRLKSAVISFRGWRYEVLF